MVSLGVFAWDGVRRTALRLAGRTPRSLCTVLYYHSVKPGQRARFARQMDVLTRSATPIPADHRNGLPRSARTAAVTFDDGFVSVLENALPELERRNIPATLFVPTGCLGSRPAWIADRAAHNYDETVLSREQLRQLSDNRCLKVGSHSVSHPNFLKLDDAEMKAQFEQSKSELERVLGKPVTLFSFPHGAHDGRALDFARRAGYERVFTVTPSRAFAEPGEFVSGRVLADPDDWALEFRLKVAGAYRWLAAAGHWKRRLLGSKN